MAAGDVVSSYKEWQYKGTSIESLQTWDVDARAALEGGNAEKARTIALTVIQLLPPFKPAWCMKGEAEMQLHDADAAASSFARALLLSMTKSTKYTFAIRDEGTVELVDRLKTLCTTLKQSDEDELELDPSNCKSCCSGEARTTIDRLSRVLHRELNVGDEQETDMFRWLHRAIKLGRLRKSRSVCCALIALAHAQRLYTNDVYGSRGHLIGNHALQALFTCITDVCLRTPFGRRVDYVTVGHMHTAVAELDREHRALDDDGLLGYMAKLKLARCLFKAGAMFDTAVQLAEGTIGATSDLEPKRRLVIAVHGYVVLGQIVHEPFLLRAQTQSKIADTLLELAAQARTCTEIDEVMRFELSAMVLEFVLELRCKYNNFVVNVDACEQMLTAMHVEFTIAPRMLQEFEPIVHYINGLSHVLHGELDTAIEAFKRAITSSKATYNFGVGLRSRRMLAISLARRGRIEEAKHW